MRLLLLVTGFLLAQPPASYPPASYYMADKGVLLPDPAVTPGAVDHHVTQRNIHATICRPNYTQTVRHVTAANKRAVLLEYGVSPLAHASYEIDHLVSLELGGSNTLDNLWPQPYDNNGAPAARDKDKLENYLHRAVCSGSMKLAEAQSAISHNWYLAYRQMVAEGKGNE